MALDLSDVSVLTTHAVYNVANRFIDYNVQSGLGRKVAIMDDYRTMTYLELKNYVNQIGNGLKSLGVRMENRVLLVCDDSCEFVGTFFAAVKMGAVPVPTNTMLSAADYVYLLNDSRATAMVVEDRIWDKISELRNKIKYLEYTVVISRSESSELQSDVVGFRELISVQSDQLETELTVYDDAAFWLYTSGSTGRPKGTIHLQHDMELAYKYYAEPILGLTANDITFSASKLFFAYGMGNGMYFSLAAGGSTVLMRERPTPQMVFSRIEKFKPTVFFGVPTLYAAMLNESTQPGFRSDFSSVRVCVSAGESLPPAIYHRFKDTFNVEILDGIGSTEALHIYISNRMKQVRPGSTGRVVPGYEVKVIDEVGNELPPGEPGQLVLKGEPIAQGYWNLHQQTKHRFVGEWYSTGDRYYYDEDAYFWYCGRQDDMLKSGGIWVSPIEIENTLMDHDLVLEVGVGGVKDENELEKPVAYVVPKDTADLSSLEADLRAFVRERLAHYKCPKQFVFVAELPKTETGKIQRFKLRVENA